MPSLTVIVPVWGPYVQWLPDLLSDIDKQTEPLDLIIVDNASEPPIKIQGRKIIRTKERLSVGQARNEALAHVTTDCVCFVDVDDRFPSDYMAFHMDHMRDNPEIVASALRPLLWDAETDKKKVSFYPPESAFKRCKRQKWFALYALFQPQLVMSGSCFRTKAIRRAGGYDNSEFREDANLSNILPFIGPVEINPGPPHRVYRQHESLVYRHQTKQALEEGYRNLRQRLLKTNEVPLYVKILWPYFYLSHKKKIKVRFEQQSRVSSAEMVPKI